MGTEKTLKEVDGFILSTAQDALKEEYEKYKKAEREILEDAFEELAEDLEKCVDAFRYFGKFIGNLQSWADTNNIPIAFSFEASGPGSSNLILVSIGEKKGRKSLDMYISDTITIFGMKGKKRSPGLDPPDNTEIYPSTLEEKEGDIFEFLNKKYHVRS